MRETDELAGLPEPLRWWTMRSFAFICAVSVSAALHSVADGPTALVGTSFFSCVTCIGFGFWCAIATARSRNIRLLKLAGFLGGSAILILSLHIFFYLYHDLFYLHRVAPALMENIFMFKVFIAHPEFTQVLCILSGLVAVIWLMFLMSVMEEKSQ
jgi:hypothetical protein